MDYFSQKISFIVVYFSVCEEFPSAICSSISASMHGRCITVISVHSSTSTVHEQHKVWIQGLLTNRNKQSQHRSY